MMMIVAADAGMTVVIETPATISADISFFIALPSFGAHGGIDVDEEVFAA
jgi:hypothetical protein